MAGSKSLSLYGVRLRCGPVLSALWPSPLYHECSIGRRRNYSSPRRCPGVGDQKAVLSLTDLPTNFRASDGGAD